MANKILKFPNRSNQYMRLFYETFDRKNIEKAEEYIVKALRFKSNHEEKIDLEMSLGKLYACSGNTNFSNLVFYNIFSQIPSEKKLLIIFLSNSLCDNDYVTAEYYWTQCNKNFDDFLSIVDEMNNLTEEFEDAVYGEYDFGTFISNQNVFINNPDFHLVNKYQKHDNFIANLPEMILGKKTEEYFEEIEQFIKNNPSSRKKIIEIYETCAKSCFQDKNFEQMNCFCDKLLLFDKINPIALGLKSNYAKMTGDESLYQNSLDNLKNINEDKMYVIEELYMFFEEIDNAKAIKVLIDRYLELNADMPEIRTMKAIYHYNYENKKTAKDIFLNLLNVYDNFVSAKHYLFLIKHFPEIKKIGALETQYELISEYEAEINRFAEADINIYAEITSDSEILLALDFAVRIGWHFENSYKVINNIVSSKNKEANGQLLKFLLYNQSVESKADIVYAILSSKNKATIVTTIDDMIESYEVLCFKIVKNEYLVLYEAYKIACSYIIAEYFVTCDRAHQEEINRAYLKYVNMKSEAKSKTIIYEEKDKNEIIQILLEEAIGRDGIKTLLNKRRLI